MDEGALNAHRVNCTRSVCGVCELAREKRDIADLTNLNAHYVNCARGNCGVCAMVREKLADLDITELNAHYANCARGNCVVCAMVREKRRKEKIERERLKNIFDALENDDE